MSPEFENPGKGGWVWKTHKSFEYPYVRKDTPPLLDQLAQLNLDTVIIKVAQGGTEYRDIPDRFPKRFNVTEELVHKLQDDMGLKVFGYTFLEGVFPKDEGKKAAEIKKRLGLDGIVLDVEDPYDVKKSAVKKANSVLDGYRSLDPEGLLVNCSWAKPDLHYPEVIAAFMREHDGCSIFAPMEYYPAKKGWDLTKVALDYLASSYSRYANHVEPLLAGRKLSFAPVLRAFYGNGGWTDPATIEAAYHFCRQEGNTVGASYWSLDFLSTYGRNTDPKSLYFGWHDAVAKQPLWNEAPPTV